MVEQKFNYCLRPHLFTHVLIFYICSRFSRFKDVNVWKLHKLWFFFV